jgi:hypothetical protein
MFGWLLRLLGWKQRRRPIRTVEDLAAAIQAGEVKPHIYREGEVQVADLFAETGLSLRERKKVMIRSCGFPAGIRMYVHRQCSRPYLETLPGRAQTTFPPHQEEWSPADLIGRFPDVTHCDHCRQLFQPTDEGYLAYWVVSQEEFALWEEVQREPPVG